MVTTSSIEGKKIKEYRGVIFGEAISGVHFLKDFAAGISNFVGGRVSEYEEEIVNARADAITEMQIRAEKVGANAIIGLHIDIDVLGSEYPMIVVSASGTAVVMEDK